MATLSPLSIFNALIGIPTAFSGESADFFNDYFDVLVYCEVLYILLIIYGPKFMANRAPINTTAFTAVWNLSLSLYSLRGFMMCFLLVGYLFRDRGIYEMTCHFDMNVLYDGECSFWVFSFLLSKIPEMIDTVLLVLQKKPIIFLHWFHHLTVTIFCWYAGLALIPSGLWFATMNYGVHSVMYLYYFFCTIGLRRYVRIFAPFITSAQLLQMFAGTGIVLYTSYYSYISPLGCGVDRRTIRMGLGMYGTYCLLFAMLFSKLYLKNSDQLKKVN